MESTVAVVGPGAIGAAVAAAIEATGRHDLVVCARRPVGALRIERDGVEPVTLRAPVLVDPDTADAVDWVLLAVKAHQTAGAGEWLRHLIGPATTVVVLQNGVRHAERVAAYIGDAAVVPASIWIGAEAIGASVRLRGATRITVPDDAAGRRFAQLLAGSWLDVEPVADFLLESWRKLTLNAIGCLMVLTGRRAATFGNPEILELSRRLALEAAAVARAEGAPLTDGAAAKLVSVFATLPPDAGSSITFDREKELPLEWHALSGIVRDLGRLHGVPTPAFDVVVPLLAAASG
jgi:2-dehydropantoate 2-reductase